MDGDQKLNLIMTVNVFSFEGRGREEWLLSPETIMLLRMIMLNALTI